MSEGGFFEFRSLVSTSVIKVIYLIGMMLLSLLSIVQIVISIIVLKGYELGSEPLRVFTEGDQGTRLVVSIFALILGNLFWRLFCEGWILLFSIHEILASIENELKKRNTP